VAHSSPNMMNLERIFLPNYERNLRKTCYHKRGRQFSIAAVLERLYFIYNSSFAELISYVFEYSTDYMSSEYMVNIVLVCLRILLTSRKNHSSMM
jgi:uncharacterized membrane protein